MSFGRQFQDHQQYGNYRSQQSYQQQPPVPYNSQTNDQPYHHYEDASSGLNTTHLPNPYHNPAAYPGPQQYVQYQQHPSQYTPEHPPQSFHSYQQQPFHQPLQQPQQQLRQPLHHYDGAHDENSYQTAALQSQIQSIGTLQTQQYDANIRRKGQPLNQDPTSTPQPSRPIQSSNGAHDRQVKTEPSRRFEARNPKSSPSAANPTSHEPVSTPTQKKVPSAVRQVRSDQTKREPHTKQQAGAQKSNIATATTHQSASQGQIPQLPIDFQTLLLSLADEYLNAAREREFLAGIVNGVVPLEQYHKLVSTGLGCIESVLKKWRLPPLKEAQLRLRYARILLEETNNDLEIETHLTKTEELCNQHKLFDMKYAAQMLQVRLLCRSSKKAGLKRLDEVIDDIEAYKHVPWYYVAQLLRARLSVESLTHQDIIATLSSLDKVAKLARGQGDHVLQTLTAVLKALTYLQGNEGESVESSQQALATARQYQLDVQVSRIPQLQIMLQFIDLCCSLEESNVEDVAKKLKIMQQSMDNLAEDESWNDDGTFSIPLSQKTTAKFTFIDSGLFQKVGDSYELTFTWLPKADVYALGYLLSAISVAHKNGHDGHKSETFLDEALSVMHANMAGNTISESMTAATSRRTWRHVFECQCLIHKTFLLCARTSWDEARAMLQEVDLIIHDVEPNQGFKLLARYLDAAIYQGTGDSETALSIFRSSAFAIPEKPSRSADSSHMLSIVLLANLNAILIVHDPSSPHHNLLSTLLRPLQRYLDPATQSKFHVPKSVIAAITLIQSIIPATRASTLLTKQYFGQTLNLARSISNAQITAITLNLMSDRFAKGVVGEQAEKSARAAQSMAKRAQDRTWLNVADGLVAETMEVQGKREESRRAREEADRIMGGWPEGMRRFEVVKVEEDDEVAM